MKEISQSEFSELLKQNTVSLTEDLYIKPKQQSWTSKIRSYLTGHTPSNKYYTSQNLTQSFNGNGHTIYNVPGTLFTYTKEGTEFKNVTLVMKNPTNGPLICMENRGVIKNVTATIDLNTESELFSLKTKTKSNLSVLVGRNTQEIKDCTVNGCFKNGFKNPNAIITLTGSIARKNAGTITNCVSKMDFKGDFQKVGGIAGKNRGEITECRFEGTIQSSVRATGGIVGVNYGSIKHCTTNSATLTSEGVQIGGIVGDHSIYSTIDRCTVTDTEINGNQVVGGIAGSTSGLIQNSEITTDVTINGKKKIGGLSGKSMKGSKITQSIIQPTVTPAKISGCLSGVISKTDIDSIIIKKQPDGIIYAIGKIREDVDFTNCYYHSKNGLLVEENLYAAPLHGLKKVSDVRVCELKTLLM